ncbi:MAG: ABC transporter substrate-binding protein [Alphaproteobacteria bacterium]|nr:MAG: ABC transporter substrate-binding protein [Alphaproteobacteria bacterium]
MNWRAPLLVWPALAASFPIAARDSSERFRAFFETLHALGRIDGQTIVIDRRSAEDRPERFPELARECIDRKSDLIVAQTTPAAQAAKKATSTIPIVMISAGDAVGSGLVDSLARPGGNITGVTFIAPALAVKRLELLKEAAPRLSRFLLLSYPVDPVDAGQVKAMEHAAGVLGVTLHKQEIRSATDLASAFESGRAAQSEALIMSSVSLFFTRRVEILERAGRLGWPGAYPWREYAEGGGLIYYAQRIDDLSRRAAFIVDRILKGAKPADIPFEQPTKFDLVINLKAAKALGITIPQSLLARADEVIE